MDMAFAIHPIAEIFPLIEGGAFDEFVEDIRLNGLREPIVLFDGKVLDGRNRLRACERLGIAPETKNFAGENPLAFVVSANLRRRHLKDSQRSLIAARVANMPHGGRPDRKMLAENITIEAAADLLNVKPRSVQWARQAAKSAAPGVVRLVERGQLSVSAAGKISRLPVLEQERLLGEGPAAITARARQIDRARGRQGRSEYAILWDCIDRICASLESADLGNAHIAASRLVKELARVGKSRRA